MRTNYIERLFEEDIDLKNLFRIKNLPDPLSSGEVASKKYVDNKFTDPSILENTSHIDLNDRNITNAGFIQVNQLPQIESHLTAKSYVDNAIPDGINEKLLLRLDPAENLKQDSIILNSTVKPPKTIIELPTKIYVDNKLNDPIIIKNTEHVDFKAKNLGTVGWVKVSKMPEIV